MTVPVRIVDNDANEEMKLLFGDLLPRFVCAESWQKLDGWLARASQAHLQGTLSNRQLEKLVEQSIETSRTIPEN